MAALLYSNTSQGCILSPDYVQNFEKPLDVFSAKSKTDAQIMYGRLASPFPCSLAQQNGVTNSRQIADELSCLGSESVSCSISQFEQHCAAYVSTPSNRFFCTLG
jgi:hypothetical protein